jgi:hypothetical protein
LIAVINEIPSGTVFQPAIMPTGLPFNEVTSEIANDIANVVRQFTDRGIEVWLRFAHEMNWYVQDGTYTGCKFHGVNNSLTG